MKIFLLRLDQRRHVFYSEGPETIDGEDCEEETTEEKRGVRGWLVKKLRSCKETISGSGGETGGFIWRLWRWLQRFVGADEPLLRGLRKAKAIYLHHPEAMSPERARSAWLEYLAGRRRHHLIWLGVNLLICPLSIVLAPIPGPNFLGYWFVYRAACHALALIGVQRVRDRRVETSLIPTGVLDAPVGRADAKQIADLASHCGLSGLDVFLVRLGAGREAAESRATGPAPEVEEAPVGHRGD